MIEPAERELSVALGVERWVADVRARAPFASLDDLLATAAEAATPLSPAEIDEAIGHHPRIGASPAAGSEGAEHSRREQASADAADAALSDRLAAGNAAYERRFGRIFLIRAAGRSRAQIVAELERRLQLDDDTELGIVGEQLREIALLRLEAMFG